MRAPRRSRCNAGFHHGLPGPRFNGAGASATGRQAETDRTAPFGVTIPPGASVHHSAAAARRRASRDLYRAAVLSWMTPLADIRSMNDTVPLRADRGRVDVALGDGRAKRLEGAAQSGSKGAVPSPPHDVLPVRLQRVLVIGQVLLVPFRLATVKQKSIASTGLRLFLRRRPLAALETPQGAPISKVRRLRPRRPGRRPEGVAQAEHFPLGLGQRRRDVPRRGPWPRPWEGAGRPATAPRRAVSGPAAA